MKTTPPQFLTTSEPTVLAQYGLGAFALYLLAPSLLGGLFGGLRGYAGDINAVQVRAACSLAAVASGFLYVVLAVQQQALQ